MGPRNAQESCPLESPTSDAQISLRPDRCPALNVCEESRQETLLVSERRIKKKPLKEEEIGRDDIPSSALFDASEDIACIHFEHLYLLTHWYYRHDHWFGLWFQQHVRNLAIEQPRINHPAHAHPLGDLEQPLAYLPKLYALEELIFPQLLSQRKSEAKKYKSLAKNAVPYAVKRKEGVQEASKDIQELLKQHKPNHPTWIVPKITFCQLL